MSEPRTPPTNDAPATPENPPSAEPPIPRTCYNCRHAVWDPGGRGPGPSAPAGPPVRDAPTTRTRPAGCGRSRTPAPAATGEPRPAPPVRVDPDGPGRPGRVQDHADEGPGRHGGPGGLRMAQRLSLARDVQPGPVLRRHGGQRQIDLDAPHDHEPAAGHAGGPQEQGPPEQPPRQPASRHSRVRTATTPARARHAKASRNPRNS